MRINIFLFFLFLNVTLVNAQRERDYWYFGDHAAIRFQENNFVGAINDSQMIAEEGCSSVSDPNTGELLFYSNGVTVWNKNHEIMENGDGLAAHIHATNSALIIRKPQDDHIYYLFTTRIDCTKPRGFEPISTIKYSVIDMRENDGLGKVIERDISFQAATAEKILAIPHANGFDQWIITYRPTLSQLVATKITAEGPQEQVFYTLPEVFSVVCGPAPSFGSTGYMSAAPNANTFAFVDHAIGVLSIFRFDSFSGLFSNEVNIDVGKEAYGVAFSPNSRKLYVSFAKTDNTKMENHLIQFDLTVFNKQAIEESKVNIISRNISNGYAKGAFGAMQLGPDNKIYVASSPLGSPNQRSKLSVINNPNGTGFASGISVHSIALSPNTKSAYGLPQFQYFNAEVDFSWTDVCIGSETNFRLLGAQAESITWNFNDPDSGDQNISNEKEPVHIFSAPGEYAVTVDVVDTYGRSYNITNTVNIYERPQPNTTAYYEVENFFLGAIIPHDNLTELISTDIENEKVEYYYSESDAEMGLNSQDDPVTYPTGKGYAKVINKVSGCSTIVPFDVKVIVLDEQDVNSSCYPIFPNAFSPNNNGVNDTFLFFNTEEHDCEITALAFEVYNRWGEKVYEGNNASWNGLASDGSELEQGVYTYHFSYSFKNNYSSSDNLSHSGTFYLFN